MDCRWSVSAGWTSRLSGFTDLAHSQLIGRIGVSFSSDLLGIAVGQIVWSTLVPLSQGLAPMDRGESCCSARSAANAARVAFIDAVSYTHLTLPTN